MVKVRDLIQEMLEDGYKPKEIANELGCSIQTVYNTKHMMKRAKVEGERELQDEYEDEDTKEAPASEDRYVRKAQIPKEKTPEHKLTEYECGGCGHIWVAPEDEYQYECPACGAEF